MIAILVGLAFILTGLWGIARWFPEFLLILQGFLPLSLVLGGIVTLITGVLSLPKKKRSNEKIRDKQ